jgi:hypothetical protein
MDPFDLGRLNAADRQTFHLPIAVKLGTPDIAQFDQAIRTIKSQGPMDSQHYGQLFVVTNNVG